MKTERWSSELINIDCSNYKTIPMLGSTRIADKYMKNEETIGRVYLRQHKAFIFLVNSTLMGVYSVEKNLLHYVTVKINEITLTAAFGEIMVLKEKLVFLSFKSGNDPGITLWQLQLKHLLKNCSDSTLTFNIIAYVDRYPRLQWDAKRIGTADNVWYLMQESQKKVQMWRLELDSLMWTLYDPDQMPGINSGLSKIPGTSNVTIESDEGFLTLQKFYHGARFEAACSATRSNDVAFFGSRLGYDEHGKDDLWIYTVNLRQWSKIEADETAPKKLTSYASRRTEQSCKAHV